MINDFELCISLFKVRCDRQYRHPNFIGPRYCSRRLRFSLANANFEQPLRLLFFFRCPWRAQSGLHSAPDIGAMIGVRVRVKPVLSR